jgi:hypothetical protein
MSVSQVDVYLRLDARRSMSASLFHLRRSALFSFSTRLFKSFFPILTKCMAQRRAERIQRRHGRFVHPRLECLEDRVVLNAYTFTGLDPLSPQTWTDPLNWSVGGGGANGTLPGADDDVTIPAGQTAILNTGSDVTIQSLTVNGSLTVGSNLTVEANGNPGSGSTSVAAGGGLVVGNPSNPGSSPAFDTTSLTDLGTVTVSAAAGGSVGTLDATTVSVGGGSGTGTFYVGDPGTGSTGTVDVSGGMSVGPTALLQVGGVGSGGSAGSSGKLDVGTLTTAVGGSNFIINTNGETDVASSGTLSGINTIAGVLQADNIDAFSGANVTVAGSVVVPSGPLKGNLIAEVQAANINSS